MTAILGTADAQRFWAHHPGGAAWCAQYRDSAWAPSRDWAVDGVRSFGAVGSVLELGCHCGPLLRRLAALPGVGAATGVDVNAEAVAVARADGLTVELASAFDALVRRPTRSVDVVVSCYCLAYVAPGDIVATLAECLRVAELGLVLVEPSAGPGVAAGVLWGDDDGYAGWRHEYLDVLEAAAQRQAPLVPPATVTFTRTRTTGVPDLNAVIIARTTWLR